MSGFATVLLVLLLLLSLIHKLQDVYTYVQVMCRGLWGPEQLPKTGGQLRCTIFNITQVVGFATVLLVLLLLLSLIYKLQDAYTYMCKGLWGPEQLPKIRETDVALQKKEGYSRRVLRVAVRTTTAGSGQQ